MIVKINMRENKALVLCKYPILVSSLQNTTASAGKVDAITWISPPTPI